MRVVEGVFGHKEIIDCALFDAFVLAILQRCQLLVVLELISGEHIRLIKVVVVKIDELCLHDTFDRIILRLLVEVARNEDGEGLVIHGEKVGNLRRLLNSDIHEGLFRLEVRLTEDHFPVINREVPVKKELSRIFELEHSMIDEVNSVLFPQ